MENRLWKDEYYLRASDFDKYNNIKLSAILDLFQDAAGRHALTLGVGFDDMLKRSYLWVLVKIKLQIISQPKSYQKVTVKTWPLAPQKLYYRREYSIENQSGEKLIVGSSEWVVIDSEKRKFVSNPNLYPFTDNFYPEINFEERLAKVPDFKADATPYTVTPGFCELDANDHVNNTKYANYVLDAISPEKDFQIDLFQIDFKKEVMQGSKLEIYTQKEDEVILSKGLNQDGETMFACYIKCK
ncbi:MAG: hypothetical protein IKA12_00830 [Clostridia bacterium]|nr:hypothetical protein [Clostridia bacterium]